MTKTFLFLALAFALTDCALRGKLSGEKVLSVPLGDFLQKGMTRERFYDFRDETLAAFYPTVGVLRVWTPKLRYAVTNALLRKTERVQFKKNDELLLVNWNGDTKSVELTAFHLGKKIFRELPKWQMTVSAPAAAPGGGDTNAGSNETVVFQPAFFETPMFDSELSDRNSSVILVGNTDILVLEKNADKNSKLLHYSIPPEVTSVTQGGVFFQRIRLAEEEGLCTLVYFQGGKRGIERTLLKRYDYVKGAVKNESWFDTDPVFYFDMAGDDACAFTSVSKDQKTLLFDIFSLGKRSLRSRKSLSLEKTDMPVDFRYIRGDLTGYLVEDTNVSFYRWN